jgi:UDP-N-acetylmuramyl tripeptide synthase
MRLLDSRRYTGPNLVWDRPSAVLDIDCDPGQTDAIVRTWRAQLAARLASLKVADWDHACHVFEAGGVSLALAAPIDLLYVAIEINEAAWAATLETLSGESASEPPATDQHLASELAAQRQTKLIALQAAASGYGVTMLWDDDEVSLGLGRHAQVWPADALPRPEDVNWADHGDIPVGLVTGTNGKTTSVRLAVIMVRAANLNVGLSSTDWVGVNDRIIDRGDYSGPGGARAALRETDVDVAILETARGGLLRRGLGIDHARAALITNIAEDHLGDFGSRNLKELLNIKWIVTRTLGQNSVAVLNADDPLLVAKATELSVPICWFALSPDHPLVAAHTAEGALAVSVIDDQFARFDGSSWQTLCAVSDAPLTLDGAARHNVANALGAIGLVHALGVEDAAIVRGLKAMTAADNPGRCNIYDVDGVEVLVDFAHNPQGMAAIFELASRRPATKRHLAFAQAGDRPNASLIEQAQVAWQHGFATFHVSELATYHRGRAYREVFGVLHDALVECGAHSGSIFHYDEEVDALDAALAAAKPGELVVMLALGEAAAISAKLLERGHIKQ